MGSDPIATASEPDVLEVAAPPSQSQRLYRAAYGLCGHREDAQDLVQETYLRVLRRPRIVRRDNDIAYLLRVLRNTWISRHRTARTRPVAAPPAELEFVVDPHGDHVAALELHRRMPPLIEPREPPVGANAIDGSSNTA